MKEIFQLSTGGTVFMIFGGFGLLGLAMGARLLIVRLFRNRKD